MFVPLEMLTIGERFDVLLFTGLETNPADGVRSREPNWLQLGGLLCLSNSCVCVRTVLRRVDPETAALEESRGIS
jgi:hypothetical protein